MCFQVIQNVIALRHHRIDARQEMVGIHRKAHWKAVWNVRLTHLPRLQHKAHRALDKGKQRGALDFVIIRAGIIEGGNVCMWLNH